MTPRRVYEGSLRLGRLELTRVALAVGISLLLHLGGFGTYKLGQHFNFWQRLPAWMHRTPCFGLDLTKVKELELKLMFVDVNPQAATPEPPKDAKFISNMNSTAANPEADKETEMPKITGQQTEIVKAEDVPRANLDRAQPALPPKEQEPAPERTKPKAPTPPGDLAMAKPDANPRPDAGTTEQPRPRTLKDVMMRQNRNQTVGEKMKQDAGTSRLRISPGFDTKSTPFGNYEAALIDAVSQHWYDLMDQISYDGFRAGQVEVEFRLHYDGRITDMKIIRQNVGDLLSVLCEKAVLDPAPFDRWPMEVRKASEKDYKDMHWVFLYRM